MGFPVHTVGTLEANEEDIAEICITQQLEENSCICGINIPGLIRLGHGLI